MSCRSASRGQTPEPGPRSGSSTSGREGSMGVRSSDDQEAAATRSDQRFRANPAHLFHPRESGHAASTSADATAGSEPFPRRRHRVAAPVTGPMATGGDSSGAPAAAPRGSWDRPPEGRSRADELPSGGARAGENPYVKYIYKPVQIPRVITAMLSFLWLPYPINPLM